MKKIVWIVIVFAGLACNSFAQESGIYDTRNNLILGIKGGANYSNVYDSQGENFNSEPKYGLAAGAFLSIPIGKYLGIHPEVLFSQKGFHASGMVEGNSYNYTRTTNYLDVPLYVAFKPSRFLSIVAGPQYSYLLKQNDVFASDNMTMEQEIEYKQHDIRKNTLCFVGGVDINLRRYVFGLRTGWDVQNNNADGTATTPRYKNVWYQGTIGIKF